MFVNEYVWNLDDPNDTILNVWAEGLAGYSADEIKIGLRMSMDVLSAPSLGQFKKLCLSHKKINQYNLYKKPLTTIADLDTLTIIAKAEKRLIDLTNGIALEDFDESTEEKMENYYATRKQQRYQHSIVTDFLAAYKGN